ncbi:D-2-hydroxyacid dehydrogenase [Arthrobacter sp. H14]|uniref:D-2-hydroxyacid dehydrogenase n=1 Tax=Arthrobacter sp. H14 TaxID=1312959 RepID=UPI003FA43417
MAAIQNKPKLVVLGGADHPKPAGMDEIEARADVHYADADSLAEVIEGADALLLWDFFSSALKDAWPHADKLRWVHVAAAGVDAILFDELAASDVVITNAHGTFDRPIAEYVLAAVFAHNKDLYRSHDLQRGRTWQHRETRLVAGSKALVVGTGGIGRETARLLSSAGIEVRGVGRTARENDDDFGTVVASSGLVEHVGWADHVVVIAPLTEQTRGMINAEVLAAMDPSAHLINVGRGQLVDEAALIEALMSGSIAAASLDVFEEEPLPESNPLWDLPSVHVSAHMSGDVIGWRGSLGEQFKENAIRWLDGGELANVVDKERGYVSGSK